MGRKTVHPKYDKKDDPQAWAASFLHQTLSQKANGVKTKAVITHKRSSTTWQQLSNYKHLA